MSSFLHGARLFVASTAVRPAASGDPGPDLTWCCLSVDEANVWPRHAVTLRRNLFGEDLHNQRPVVNAAWVYRGRREPRFPIRQLCGTGPNYEVIIKKGRYGNLSYLSCSRISWPMTSSGTDTMPPLTDTNRPFIPRYLSSVPDGTLDRTADYYDELIAELKKCEVAPADKMTKRLQTATKCIHVEKLRRLINRTCGDADIGL